MKILYYTWNEITQKDCVECMRLLGWSVDIYSAEMKDLTADDRFREGLSAKLKTGYDCIFSFDYFPLISETAQDENIPYISWVYDSPHLTLQSKTLDNPCNRVYVFDYGLVCRYRSEGFDTVDYMPLACNIRRLEKKCSGYINSPTHDVTFLGNLYNDQNNLYDQIGYLPEFIKGYLDAVIIAQEQLFGIDLASELISDELCTEISGYVKADLDHNYRPSANEILRGMIRKKVTVNERHKLLRELGNRFKMDIYSSVRPYDDIRASYRGYADYYDQMPVIFASSRININITLRSILTGIPLRIIDILGAGGFVISNYQAELSEYFENERSIVWYDSVDDMIDKVSYYLEHNDERMRIAAAGHEVAREAFSYESILPRLLNES